MQRARELVHKAILESIGDSPYGDSTEFRDLGIDSLDLVELLLRVEDELGVEINEKQLGRVDTVGQFIVLVNSYVERT